MKIYKVLSANDIGATGSHQAGIHIPKKGEILKFFPSLNAKLKNPRRSIMFYDDKGKPWRFNFIYYNNEHFGGTRNEYRLTGVSSFLKAVNAREDDVLELERVDSESFRINIKSKKTSPTNVLTLSKNWKVIKR